MNEGAPKNWSAITTASTGIITLMTHTIISTPALAIKAISVTP